MRLNYPQFAAIITDMGKAFGVPVSPVAIGAFFQRSQNLTIDDIRAVYESILDKEERFPVPAVWLSHVRGYIENAHAVRANDKSRITAECERRLIQYVRQLSEIERAELETKAIEKFEEVSHMQWPPDEAAARSIAEIAIGGIFNSLAREKMDSEVAA